MGHKTSGSTTTGPRNALGKALRYFRQKEGITAEELSSRIELENSKFCFDISADHLNKVERCEKPLTDFLLLAYAEALNVQVVDFFEFYLKEDL